MGMGPTMANYYQFILQYMFLVRLKFANFFLISGNLSPQLFQFPAAIGVHKKAKQRLTMRILHIYTGYGCTWYTQEYVTHWTGD